jgi:patatin-like phospholipase/acyl hydrolase
VRHHHRVPEEVKIASVPDAYRVLCISGGGYRGLYAARLLAQIEANPRFGTGPIGTRFDMIAGTSVGGLIGAALALVKRNLKLIQLRTQTQYKFDTPAHTVFS